MNRKLSNTKVIKEFLFNEKNLNRKITTTMTKRISTQLNTRVLNRIEKRLYSKV